MKIFTNIILRDEISHKCIKISIKLFKYKIIFKQPNSNLLQFQRSHMANRNSTSYPTNDFIDEILQIKHNKKDYSLKPNNNSLEKEDNMKFLEKIIKSHQISNSKSNYNENFYEKQNYEENNYNNLNRSNNNFNLNINSSNNGEYKQTSMRDEEIKSFKKMNKLHINFYKDNLLMSLNLKHVNKTFSLN